MDIGYILWFGGYSKKAKEELDYGFIQSLTFDDRVFIHASEIADDSQFLDKMREGVLVAFNIRTGRKGLYAYDLHLLSEIPVHQIPGNMLQNPKVKSELFSLYPEQYADSPPNDYFQFFSDERVRKLYYKKHQNDEFPNTAASELVSYLESVSPIWTDSVWNDYNWSREPIHELISLCVLAKNRNLHIGSICSMVPQLLEDPQIPIILDLKDWEYILDSGYKIDPIFHNLIVNVKNNDIKTYLCSHAELATLSDTPESYLYISPENTTKIIEHIDWDSASDHAIRDMRAFLGCIEADRHEIAAYKIAVRMYQQNVPLNLKWWIMFTDSVKVRILIYYSNLVSNKTHSLQWLEEFKKIREHEQSKNNLIICALLEFLRILYPETDIDIHEYNYENKIKERKNRRFIKAHELLIRYILECFSNDCGITPALNTLLDICFCGYCDKPYFCDAKIQGGDNNAYVFCPQGQSRTYSRRECNYRSGKGLTYTPYQETGRFEYQHLTDFLRNLNFIPDLYCLGIQDATLWEYSYKISSQVNRLISLRPHMKCRCGNWLISNFKYSKKIDALISSTVFNCSSTDAQSVNPTLHDYNVYLNHCYHCKKPVDSRECKIREGSVRGQNESKGPYLCMNCGGSPHFAPGTVCPNCGTEIFLSRIRMRNKQNIIHCTRCYHLITIPQKL